MLISIFALILFYYLSQFISNRIKEIKTNNNKENQQNFWMFTYDFKKEKKESIFDRDTIEMIHLKNKINKLIISYTCCNFYLYKLFCCSNSILYT